MMYQTILFDLDGTLTASGEGITKCVQYALEKFGIYEPDLKKLEVFIGPPLKDMMMQYAGMNEEQAEQAVRDYRERYSEKGIFENRPYPGIENMLRTLQERGYRLAVASSKPTHYVLQILEHFHLRSFFEVVVGSEMNGKRVRKAEVIEEALARLGVQNDREHVVMVGDREHDILGARQEGLACVAVGYGYGSQEELEAAEPVAIVNSVEELLDFFE